MKIYEKGLLDNFIDNMHDGQVLGDYYSLMRYLEFNGYKDIVDFKNRQKEHKRIIYMNYEYCVIDTSKWTEKIYKL